MSRVAVHRALVSVSDKAGLETLARRLTAVGVELVSSGGTAEVLAAWGIPVTTVSEVTGAPEILGGRVKTLHPRIHGGILADPARAEHRVDLEEQGIEPFQLVVVNLYPFRETVADPEVAEETALEEIDIGGPAMVRAAAKNHLRVGVVTSPNQYDEVAEAVESGGLDDALRRRLAREAFFHTASYDAAILRWLEREEALPSRLVLPLRREQNLRYGENPHQAGAAYRLLDATAWWTAARRLQGKEMSFNNYADADAAWRLVGEFSEPAAAIVKHTNPCGVAEAASLPEAYRAAWECDPLSAFGGVVAVNRPLDGHVAAEIAGVFVEVVVAPEVSAAAAETLAGKKNLRLLEAPRGGGEGVDLRRVDGGVLAQTWDRMEEDRSQWQVVTAGELSPSEWDDLEFAWKVAAYTTSNAVVVARDRAAVGIGAGDQSRVGAAQRAVHRAGDRAAGAVAASDAFFPFRDGLDVLASAGVTAVVEPGGSRRDEEVIAAAEEHGIALVFTGRRHFRH